jgi:perosamine synthetase
MIPIAKPQVGKEEEEAVLAVLRSGHLASGPVTEAFEKEFAASVGTDHAIAVANGTAALHLALEGAGIGPGDEVIIPAFTFVATANAVRMTGATPVFADIDEHFNLDAVDAARAVTEQTRAIMPVHLYGLGADMGPLAELANKHDLLLVEDAAQAHGATWNKRAVGSIGRLGCFSFYPTKNMTTGEGGIITTDDAELAATIRSLRNHGRGLATLGTYDHVRHGYNLRTTDLQSALGRVQLGRLPAWNEARRANAKALDQALEGLPGITTPVEPRGRRHVYHQYTIRAARRDALVQGLPKRGVGVGVYYPKVLYQYAHLQGYARRCPRAEEAAREVLSLPVHPGVGPAEVATIAAAVGALG